MHGISDDVEKSEFKSADDWRVTPHVLRHAAAVSIHACVPDSELRRQ